jgi:hypothetical protein
MLIAKYSLSTRARLADKCSNTPGLYAVIGEGMDNQVFRNGMSPKKTPDRDRKYIRAFRIGDEDNA